MLDCTSTGTNCLQQVHIEKLYFLSQALSQSPHTVLCGCIESISRIGHTMRRHGRYVDDMAPLPSSLHILHMLNKVACSVTRYCNAYAKLMTTQHTADAIANSTIWAGG